jgi:hypothetical protein
VWLNHDAYVDLDGQDDRFPSRSAIALNTWTQVTVVYDGTQAVDQRAQIYINGMLDSAHSETSASLTAFTSALHIGCMPAPAMTLEQGFVGELDEVAIWNRALTALEIAQWNVNTRPATASP